MRVSTAFVWVIPSAIQKNSQTVLANNPILRKMHFHFYAILQSGIVMTHVTNCSYERFRAHHFLLLHFSNHS